MNISQIARAGSAKACMVYHENPDIFHVNTLENHCYFIPFGSGKGQNPFLPRGKSERFELLNGKWGFRYYNSIINLEDDLPAQPLQIKRKCRFLQTGSFTATTSHNIQMLIILYHIILPLFRMKIPAVSITAPIITRRMALSESFALKVQTAVSIFM